MARILVVLALATVTLPAFAGEKFPKPDRIAAEATPEQVALIREGVALHDQHNYDAAIEKYKEVLKQNPWELAALHELGFTYFESKHYPEAVATARLGMQCKSKALPLFYILMGNSLDELGKSKDAIEVYRFAIRQSPDVGLLHYNLAVSLRRAGKAREAKPEAQIAIQSNPNHASSHYALGAIYGELGYRVPAILAYSRSLLLEPDSARARQVLPVLQGMMTSGVTNGKDANHINILMNVTPKALLDEGDFSSVDLAMSIHLAADRMAMSADSKKKPSTPFERLASMYVMIGESAANAQVKGGFAASYYAPFFSALAKAGHAQAFVACAWSAGAVPGAAEWAEANGQKIDDFKAWAKAYEWPAAK